MEIRREPAEHETQTTGRVEVESNDVCLFSLPASCMERLVFGARFSEHARTDIVRSIRSQPELAHLELSEAHLRQDEYGLEIRPLAA